jgi:transposase
MLSFAGSLRVFLSVEPCDLRKSFEGLYALAESRLGEDPRGGAIFVFCNRRRDRLKILYFDGSGLWVMTKRLEQGTFWWPKSADGSATALRLAPEALAMLTDGIELRHGGKRAWYEENK